MKMKKILIIISLLLAVLLIYFLKENKKINCIEITDTNKIDKKYINKNVDNYFLYQKKEYRIIDFLYDIKDNKEIKYKNKKYPINNLFVKCDLIVINIGHNDLKYVQKKEDIYKHLDKMIKDYEEIINSIKKISKEKIVIIYDYEIKSKYNDYLYNKLNNLKDKYNIEVLNLLEYENYYKTFTK